MNTHLKEFSWPVRVYYEDTDSGGVVYYANYLKFMERARSELLRDMGFEQDELQQELGIVFAVHSANIRYKKPARFNDELNVVTSLTTLGKASIDFKQSVYLHASHHDDAPVGSLLCDAEIKIACINADKFSPQIIPASIIHQINSKLAKEPESGS